MKKFFIGLTGFCFLFAGCAVPPQIQQQERINVVTSFYPLYEIARQVGGEYVEIRNLVPPGAEPHDFELTPKDINSLYDADILLINGVGFEVWLDKVIPELQKSGVKIVDVSKTIGDLITGSDPHIWLDPTQYIKEVAAVEQALSSVDPSHKNYYESRAQNFNTELSALDQNYTTGLQNCSTREFVTNHAAFSYLAKRYNLQMISITGFSPDAEPSPRDLAGLTDLLKQKGTKYVFVETLVSPKIGEILASEVGAQTLVLNPLESLSDEDLAAGKNYVSVMYDNLKNLQIAMDCR